MKSEGKIGFEYLVECFDASGTLIDSELVHNIMPEEGCNHMLAVTAGLVAQNPSWWIGLYKNNYTPVSGDKAATFPAAAGEFTDYEGTTRKQFIAAAPESGVLTNSASKAEFVFTQDVPVTGGFLASASGKGATTGILWSAVRFNSPKAPGVGGTLRVTAANLLVSA